MNSRKPPQDSKYKNAIFMDRLWDFLFVFSVVIVFLQIFYIKDYDELFFKTNSLILIVLFFLEYFRDKFIYEGAIIKRKNLFDTTFGLNRICDRVDEFYDNDDIDDKMIKLFANNHQSLFFTKEITSSMLITQYAFIGIIAVIFLGSVFHSGLTEINSIIMAIILSYFGVGRFLDIKSVNEESNRLFDESLRIANDMEIVIKEINVVEMLEVIVNYEALLSSMNFVLSNFIYNKKQEILTKKWLNIKERYGVYNIVHSDE